MNSYEKKILDTMMNIAIDRTFLEMLPWPFKVLKNGTMRGMTIKERKDSISKIIKKKFNKE